MDPDYDALCDVTPGRQPRGISEVGQHHSVGSVEVDQQVNLRPAEFFFCLVPE